ncbi:MAG: GGDEF domain-containing protein [Aquihabitans sp.]
MAPEWLSEFLVQGIEPFVVFDDRLQIVYANRAVTDLLHYGSGALIGMNALDLVHPEDLTRADTNLDGMASGAKPSPGLLRIRRGDGAWADCELSALRLEAPARPKGPGVLTGLVIRDHDIRDTHWTFLAALASGVDFHDCLEGLAVGLSGRIDGPLGISYDHGSTRRLAGPLPPLLAGVLPLGTGESSTDPTAFGLDTTPGTPWALALATGEPAWGLTAELPEPFGSAAAALGLGVAVAVPVADPGQRSPGLLVQWPPSAAMGPILVHALAAKPKDAVGIALERRHVVEQLEGLARRDSLTGLANRSHFFERLATLHESGRPYGVCYLDLDHFKPVNDTFGHMVGDDLLVACAARLQWASRTDDVVARLGGDEFGIINVDVDGPGLDRVAARLVDILNEPVIIDGTTFNVGASLGAALGAPGIAPDAVVAAADAALYEAKRAGRRTWRRSAGEHG